MTSFATLLRRLDRDVVAPGCMSPSTHDRRIYDQSRVDIAKVADARLRVGANTVARDAAGGVGGVEEGEPPLTFGSADQIGLPRYRGLAMTEREPAALASDAHLWHPWLRINRVLRVMLHTRWSTGAWPVVRVEFRRALAVQSEIRRAGWSTNCVPICWAVRAAFSDHGRSEGLKEWHSRLAAQPVKRSAPNARLRAR